MLNRSLVLVLSFLLGATALFAIGATASGSELGTVRAAVDSRLGDASSRVTDSARPARSGATVSRRKRRRYMPFYRARSNSLRVARYVYLDPELNLDDYGVRTCRRISRPRVDCYTYVAGDIYDYDGYYLDTILCDWYTASAYLRSGRQKVWTRYHECVLLSEV